MAGSHRGLRPRNRPPRRQHACSSLAKKPILSHQQGIPNEEGPKWSPNASQMDAQNGSMEVSWSLLEPLGLLKASWSAPGGLLERSWRAPRSKKGALERLLAPPRGVPREFSAILEAKRFPKGRPRRSKIESKRRLELKMAKPENFEDVLQNSLIFQVPRFLLGVQNQ